MYVSQEYAWLDEHVNIYIYHQVSKSYCYLSAFFLKVTVICQHLSTSYSIFNDWLKVSTSKFVNNNRIIILSFTKCLLGNSDSVISTHKH